MALRPLTFPRPAPPPLTPELNVFLTEQRRSLCEASDTGRAAEHTLGRSGRGTKVPGRPAQPPAGLALPPPGVAVGPAAVAVGEARAAPACLRQPGKLLSPSPRSFVRAPAPLLGHAQSVRLFKAGGVRLFKAGGTEFWIPSRTSAPGPCETARVGARTRPPVRLGVCPGGLGLVLTCGQQRGFPSRSCTSSPWVPSALGARPRGPRSHRGARCAVPSRPGPSVSPVWKAPAGQARSLASAPQPGACPLPGCAPDGQF